MSEKTNETALYTLTFCVDGQPCYAERVPQGTRLCALPKPEKPGFAFSGWGDVPPRMPAQNLVLEGQFVALLYTALFASGVEQYGVTELPVGSPLTPPTPPEREGYDFGGWDGFDGVMPPCNRTYEAIFTPKIYRVTYLVDEIFRFSYDCRYGEPFPILEEPIKKNFVFSGWSEIPDTVPAHDVTIKGSFTEKLYKLTRIVDETPFCEEMLPFGAPVNKKIKPVREGYYFSGWRKLPETMPAHDMTVVASMYPARYRADFYIDDTLTDSRYIPFGFPVEAPEKVDEAGRLFSGWVDLPTTMPASNISVHGHMKSILHALTFMTDTQELLRVELPTGAPLPRDVEIPPKEGFVFCGWDNEPAAMPDNDLVLHAVYATAKVRYRFEIDGEVYTEIETENGETPNMPTPPDKDGSPFGGWRDTSYDTRTGVITYWGTYDEGQVFTVTYLLRGEVFKSCQLTVGETIVDPEIPANDAIEFLGWQEHPAVMPASNLQIHAKVRVLRNQLTFVLDGKIVYSMSLSAGEEVSCPAVAQKTGYTFEGWKDPPAKMPETDLTIYGSYSRNHHTVTYRIGDEILHTETLCYGEQIILPEAPAHENYNCYFVGWEPKYDTMPDSDITMVGAYSDTVCLIDIYVDGVLDNTLRARVGDPVVLPDIKVDDGEHFEWQNVPATVPEGHLEIHGGRVANVYTITYMDGENVLGEEKYRFREAIRPHLATPKMANGTFLSWEELPETMPPHDLTVTAKYSTRVYHVTFMLDNTVFEEDDVPVGAPTPSPRVPERAGYRFDGWRNYIGVMPPYNFTVHGSYSLQSYRLTYLCADSVFAVQEYKMGDRVEAPVAPNMENRVFYAWEGLPDTMPSRDLTVSARYVGELFHVSYLIDGELVAQADVEQGSRIVPPEAPVRDGFAFAGWRDLPEFMPSREVIAVGEYKTCMYRVTYKVGDIIYRIDSYNAGDAVVAPVAPEHDKERFVRWQNLSAVMPEYDYTCVAEYSESNAHYAFILDGEVLAEGDAGKGETLTAPEAPHRSGFAFLGWDGFTGVMPGEDVNFIGSYTTDRFKVIYLLDGVSYREDPYNEGEVVTPCDQPEKEGWVFSGWSGLPSVMPADDVIVEGTMQPQKFRLIYKTDDGVLYDGEVACGQPLGFVHVPEIQGREFKGWNDEPEVMPAHPLMVCGTYARKEPEYISVAYDGDPVFGADDILIKSHPVTPPLLAFSVGGYLRIVTGDICYSVPQTHACINNARVTDAATLTDAVKHLWRKYGLPKKKMELIVGTEDMTDVMIDIPDAEAANIDATAATLFCREGEDTRLNYRALTLSHDKSEHTMRLLLSHPDEEACGGLESVFSAAGVQVTERNTPFGALAAYLQKNKKMERGKNQIALFYMPNTVYGVLMADGQVAYMVRPRFPYADRMFDVEGETKRILEILSAAAEKIGLTARLSLLAVGGIDRTHVRTGEKCAVGILRTIAKDSPTGIYGGKMFKKPQVIGMGFAYVENRTK